MVPPSSRGRIVVKSAEHRALRAEDHGLRHPRLRHRPGGSPRHKPKLGLTVKFTPTKRLDVGVLSRRSTGSRLHSLHGGSGVVELGRFRDRVSTTAVRQNAPRAYADRLGVPPGSPHLPRARRSLIPAEPVYRLSIGHFRCLARASGVGTTHLNHQGDASPSLWRWSQSRMEWSE
jgi:hypothetical protein